MIAGILIGICVGCVLMFAAIFVDEWECPPDDWWL